MKLAECQESFKKYFVQVPYYVQVPEYEERSLIFEHFYDLNYPYRRTNKRREGVTPLIVRRSRAYFREYSVRRYPGTEYAKNAGHSLFRVQTEI